MDPHMWEKRLTDELNRDFENGNDYIGGSLLSLYWQQADNAGYKDESDKVVQFLALWVSIQQCTLYLPKTAI